MNRESELDSAVQDTDFQRARVERALGNIAEQVEARTADIREMFTASKNLPRRFASEHPGRFAAAFLAVGFVLGLISQADNRQRPVN